MTFTKHNSVFDADNFTRFILDYQAFLGTGKGRVYGFIRRACAVALLIIPALRFFVLGLFFAGGCSLDNLL